MSKIPTPRPDTAGSTKEQCIVVQYFHDGKTRFCRSKMQVAHLYLKRSSFTRTDTARTRVQDKDTDTDSVDIAEKQSTTSENDGDVQLKDDNEPGYTRQFYNNRKKTFVKQRFQ